MIDPWSCMNWFTWDNTSAMVNVWQWAIPTVRSNRKRLSGPGKFAIEAMKISEPKLLLHREGFVVFVVACVVYGRSGDSWGKFAILFLVPDLFMLGYVFGRKIGARVYNVGHTYAAPFLFWLMACLLHRPSGLALALIWAAHIGFDHLLGHGLKYESELKKTHLNRV